MSLIQHPELWNAVVVESPLVDMLRYHKLSAGASWSAIRRSRRSKDHEFSQYSAYQNLTRDEAARALHHHHNKDDRVHPGPPGSSPPSWRRWATLPLYEQTFGGHANDADPELNAQRWARHYVYLAQKLMD